MLRWLPGYCWATTETLPALNGGVSALKTRSKETGHMKATIEERGNGLPDQGSYVAGDDGELYLIVEISTTIHTGNNGNWVHARVELADWDDVSEDWETTGKAIL